MDILCVRWNWVMAKLVGYAKIEKVVPAKAGIHAENASPM
jgi:hypothetical protein